MGATKPLRPIAGAELFSITGNTLDEKFFNWLRMNFLESAMCSARCEAKLKKAKYHYVTLSFLDNQYYIL